MHRTVAPIVLLLACGLALAGCRFYTSSGAGAGGAGVGSAEGADAAVKSLNTFTDELLAKVEQAGDTKAGVAEAQALLDARKGVLVRLVGALKHDPQSKARLLEAEVDNTDRVHRLQLKYADAAAGDPVLKSRLERLIADYDALFR